MYRLFFSEYSIEQPPFLRRFDMDAEAVALLAGEDDMVLEDEGNVLVELKDGCEASDQKAPERIEFLEVGEYDLAVADVDLMIGGEYLDEML